MVTGADEPSIAKTAFEIGAYDYIVKPLEQNRVLISVTNALHRRELESVSRTYRNMLEGMVAERTENLQNTLGKLQRTLDGVIHAMALTIEKRDPYTAGHQERVAHLACTVARAMELGPEQVKGLEMAAHIHDIGKIRVPSEILSKPGQLSDIEFAIIKTHPKVGYDILRPIEFPGLLRKRFTSITKKWTGRVILGAVREGDSSGSQDHRGGRRRGGHGVSQAVPCGSGDRQGSQRDRERQRTVL